MSYLRLPRPQPPPDHATAGAQATIDVEQAYRRGFHQGAALTVRAVEAGASTATLRDWLAGLRLWRRGVRVENGCAIVEMPPMPPTTTPNSVPCDGASSPLPCDTREAV